MMKMRSHLVVYVTLALLHLCKGQDDCSAMEKQCFRSQGDSNVCSGRGDCNCGQCVCHSRRGKYSHEYYTGQFCECDDYSCSFHNNHICGGHGRCECGVCRCDEGYTGEACDCPTSQSTCITAEGKVCNGVGTCECGVCKCDENLLYKGPTCEECPTCPGKCSELKPCAECKALGTGPYSSKKCQSLCEHVIVVDQVDVDLPGHRLCQFKDVQNCLFKFTYHYSERINLKADVQADKECPGNNGTQDGQNDSTGETRACVLLILLLFVVTLWFH